MDIRVNSVHPPDPELACAFVLRCGASRESQLRRKEIMDPREVQEQTEHTEHAQHQGERAVGLTTAVVAVLLAIATQLSHRAHTESIKLLTRSVDSWAFYQAKHGRAHLYGKYAEDEAMNDKLDLAAIDLKRSISEECGSPAEENCTSPILKDSPARKQLQEQVGAAKSSQHASQVEEAQARGVAAKAEEGRRDHKGQTPAAERKEGAVDVEEHAKDLENETGLVESRANLYDFSELLLDVSIVLCSITLLADTKLYWRLSFVSSAAGVVIALWAWFAR